MDILIKNMEMPKSCDECELLYDFVYCIVTKQKMLDADFEKRNPSCPLIPVPEHNDLADKSVIIERMGEVYEALYDKVDKKALSECHVAFLKAVMYAPTVIPSTDSAVVLERTT
jgi:hypothetical protein